MPVRFACPHCRQKLSVSSRKAGQEADCPRCGQSLTIPLVAEPLPPAAEQVTAPHAAAQFAEDHSAAPSGTVGPSGWAGPSPSRPPASDLRLPTSDLDHDKHGEFELVFDTSDEAAELAPVDAHLDLIAVPRMVLYLQGGLLAVVAVVSFALGLIAGGAYSGGAAPSQPRACTLEGTINYASGNRQLPDPGAVVAVIPESGVRPQRKAPVSGLRPDDATPDENHHGIAILRELGGDYTRTDDRGRFQVRVPDRGKYLVLIVSSMRDVRDLDDISTADLVKLGPFFDNAAGLLGRHEYRLTSEVVRSDRQLNVVFE